MTTADSDPKEKNRDEDAKAVAETGGGRFQRLKQFFVSRFVRVIDALRGVLKRLRNRVGKAQAEDGDGEEKEEARPSHKKARASQAEANVAPAPEAPRSPIRSAFIYILVLIVGFIGGMIFSFALFSNMVVNQAQKIEDQRDEISQLERQYSRVAQSEAKFRNRLAEAESQLNQVVRTIPKEAPPTESSTPPVASSERPANAKNAGNCKLESGNAETLARCVEEFNRKGRR